MTKALDTAISIGTFPSDLSFRNKIINGDFDIWQRGTSQTNTGYGSVDRWSNLHFSGSTKTTSQQSFTLDQTDVPGNPKYFIRTNISASSGSSTFVITTQCIENVSTLSGKTATLTFWAKADSSKYIAAELFQNFGNGGNPSTLVYGIGTNKYFVDTNWRKFSIVVNIPSIVGKTLGTSGDYVAVAFWFSAGSDFDSRSSSLGLQTGTFDLAHVSLVEGDATQENDPFSPRHIGQELFLCQRYFWGRQLSMSFYNGNGGSVDYSNTVTFPTIMRTQPTVTFLNNNANLTTNGRSINATQWGFGWIVTLTANGTCTRNDWCTADAEL